MVDLPSNLSTMFDGRFGLTGRIVNPVIVETEERNFADVEAILRDLVPERGFLPSFTGLPRLTRLAEFAFSNFKSIELFNMIGTVLTRDMVEEVAQMREVKKIYPNMIKWALQFPTVPDQGVFQDAKGKPFTSTWWTKKAIGADIANDEGFSGEGVTAVVIDSGARSTHPQLRGTQILTAAREKGQSGRDANGHGTWCSSCVGGSFATDKSNGAPVEGMAPDSNLISIQALGFVVGVGSSADIIKAQEMAIGLGADVVSMSLGSNDAPPDADNPEAIVIKRLVEAGIIPVVAGGNSGPTPETIGSPGSVAEALTVGAHDPVNGELADFSSRGPTGGDGLIKPDVIAPGVMIDSALVGLLDTMVDLKSRQFGAISGTCLSGDTEIPTNPSGLVRIDSIDIGDKVLSMDSDGNLCTKTVINKMSNGIKQTFNVKIGNREIKATLNHPFLVLKRERIKGPPKTINKKWDRKLIWKQLKDIKEGDLIIVPRKILIGKEYKLEPANDTYITLTEIGSEKLRAVKGYSINQSVYSPDNIRHVAIRDDGAVYSKLKEVFKQNGLELEHSDYTLSKKGKIPPTTTEDFCRLLGFMIGDGWVSKSSNMNVAFAAGENEERNERYCQLFKRVFGLELKLYDRGRWYYSYSRPIGKLLREWGLDKHCKEKRIDNRIFSLPITHRKEFIKGLVDADGSRFKGGITVELSNKYLIKDLRKLIQTVGWRGGEIHNRARIVQPPNSKSPIKSETWSISFSEIERKYGARNFHGDRWEDVINYNDFIVRQVKSIEPNGQEEVFDITVEGAHNFVANNILVHNSMATPHVAGLLACARQFYREKLDTILTVDMVKEAMRLNAEANGLVKDNQIGWGPITWDILTKFGESLKPPKKGVPEAIPPEEEQL